MEASMKLVRAALFAALALSTPAAIFAQAPSAPPPSELPGASLMTEDSGKSDSWTYRNPDAVLTKYQKFLIEPTVVTTDPTATWGSSSPADRQKYANYMTTALRKEVGQGYQIVDKPGPGVAILRMTLLGVQQTVPLVATVSRFTPLGFALNGIQSLRGKKGTMTGSVQAALEVSDSQTGELLFAAVRRRSPVALDIQSTLSTDDTVKAVADEFAKSIRQGIDQANGR